MVKNAGRNLRRGASSRQKVCPSTHTAAAASERERSRSAEDAVGNKPVIWNLK